MKIFLSLLCLGVLFSGCGKSPSGPKPLIVGMELAYPPFEMTDKQGQPSGVSVDMATALAKYLRRPLEIRNMSFDGLIPALKTGSIDLIISSMSVTAERAKSIDFSDPYLHTGLAILTGKNSEVETVEDLNQPGRVVAVKLGTTGHVYAKAHLDQATVRVLEKENACVMEVVQGKADAFLYDQLSVYQNAKRHPESTIAKLNAFQQESWAAGIRKGNDKLVLQVNAFIKDFREQGGFDDLGTKYLGESQRGFKELGIPFVFDSPVQNP